MFYLEIILDPNGTVQDVKVHHECKMKQQSCSELVSCLQRGDFVDFTTQLEGLASIYQLNAEKKIKVNAFVALQALETDLYNLYSLSTQLFTDIHSLLLKSPLGVVQKRRGGHAMKLSYYIAPYDLLDLEAKKMKPLNADLISAEKVGYSVAINLEASTANKLQIQPLLVHQGNSPVYSPIEKHNSTSLPATFVLRLNKPMALNIAMLKQIRTITGDNSAAETSKPVSNNSQSCLISLIVQHASNGAVSNIAKGLFVTLPDQYHCYYMTENKNLQVGDQLLHKVVILPNVAFKFPGYHHQQHSIHRTATRFQNFGFPAATSSLQSATVQLYPKQWGQQHTDHRLRTASGV